MHWNIVVDVVQLDREPHAPLQVSRIGTSVQPVVFGWVKATPPLQRIFRLLFVTPPSIIA